jgi:hypothetical protein
MQPGEAAERLLMKVAAGSFAEDAAKALLGTAAAEIIPPGESRSMTGRWRRLSAHDMDLSPAWKQPPSSAERWCSFGAARAANRIAISIWTYSGSSDGTFPLDCAADVL